MRKILALIAVVIPLVVLANVTRTRPPPKAAVLRAWRGGTMTAQALGGFKLQSDRALRITQFQYYLSGAAATATVSMVIRAYPAGDAANPCTWTIDCTSADVRGSTGQKVSTALTGSCVFPAGTEIFWQISTACTTAQPSALNIEGVGEYL